jgi:hypothetical protein
VNPRPRDFCHARTYFPMLVTITSPESLNGLECHADPRKRAVNLMEFNAQFGEQE